MRNAGLDEAQAGIKIARRNIDNVRYTDDTTLMAESKEELKKNNFFLLNMLWVAIPFSKGSSQPRDQTHVSYISRQFFTPELPGRPSYMVAILKFD